MLVMGSVIGVGIFAVPHTVAGLVGSSSLALAAWALGGVVTLAGALVYAELTRRRPQVGGQYAFLREAYHPALAFAYGWSLLWIMQSGGMASVAVIFADYVIALLKLLGAQLRRRPTQRSRARPSALSRWSTAWGFAPAAPPKTFSWR